MASETNSESPLYSLFSTSFLTSSTSSCLILTAFHFAIFILPFLFWAYLWASENIYIMLILLGYVNTVNTKDESDGV